MFIKINCDTTRAQIRSFCFKIVARSAEREEWLPKTPSICLCFFSLIIIFSEKKKNRFQSEAQANLNKRSKGF